MYQRNPNSLRNYLSAEEIDHISLNKFAHESWDLSINTENKTSHGTFNCNCNKSSLYMFTAFSFRVHREFVGMFSRHL